MAVRRPALRCMLRPIVLLLRLLFLLRLLTCTEAVAFNSALEPVVIEALKRVVKARLEVRVGDAVLDAAGVPSTGEISVTMTERLNRLWQVLLGGEAVGGESIYDCVIDMGSLRQLVSGGWPLALKSEATVDRLFAAPSSALVVSMLGTYNHGKTHVVNKLVHANYEAGLLQHTRGLSMTLPKSTTNNWLIIDSAGSNQPVHSAGGEEAKDKQMSERFLAELMLTLSDTLIVVLNALTFSDQTFLQELHLKTTRYQNREMKRVFVLHNFKDLTNTTDVEARVHEDLKLGLGCIADSAVVGDSTVRFWRDTRHWSHLVLAREDSPAGKQLNSGSLRLLETWLHGSYADKNDFEQASWDPREPREYTLGAKLLSTTQRWLPRYFDLPNATMTQLQDKLQLTMSVDAHGHPKIHLKEDVQGLRFRQPEVHHGAILGESGSFAPRFDLLHLPQHSLLLVDLPGVALAPRKLVKRPNSFRTRITFHDGAGEAAVIVVIVHHAPAGGYQHARVQLWARRVEPPDAAPAIGERQRHFGNYSHEAILLPADVRLDHADAELDASGVLRVEMRHVPLEPASGENFDEQGEL